MTYGVLPDLQGRPDLTALADRHGAAGSANGRGRLRTYLGIAPGVGKAT